MAARHLRFKATVDKVFRCLWRLGPPLTISNREVKPTCADGTSLLRVGEYVDAGFLSRLRSGERRDFFLPWESQTP